MNQEEYIDLWKYFQDRAISVKGAMFNTITWIIGFAAALLGFIFAKISDFNCTGAKISLPCLMILLSIAGIVICIYAFIALYESAKQIRKHWNRADNCWKKIEGINEIVDKREVNGEIGIQIWNQLRILVGIFIVAFVAILIWGIIMAKCITPPCP
ncbi:MAG: hypothetical protein ACYS80_25020 [Planctomycetota bacterium]|jgi:uncharacterized membrane protein